MSGARGKLIALVGIAVLAALILADWSQTWFTLTVQGKPFPVSGQVTGGALSALALASLAVIAALAIAGRFFRAVLGVLLALLGVCVIAVSAFAVGNPVVAATSAITKATGVAGAQSIGRLVTATSLTAWPVIAIVLGALMTLLGLAIAPTARSWPD
ncbi:MAG TPA: Trp biosynthesis-associated membrane protein, partial [Pseudolysinimonas sp.]|nr:Trp biosynthesis-associated membrane protein [Pseudolysinimonas sp.]